MSHAIEVINDNGIIQITNSFKNLQLVGKGTVNSWESLTFNKDDVVAIRIDSGWVGLYHNPRIINNDVIMTFVSNINPITYYKFSYADVINPISNYFEVRDSFGKIIFSDTLQPMKVINSVNSVTGAEGYNKGYMSDGRFICSVSHPPDKKTAVVVGDLAMQIVISTFAPENLARLLEQTFSFNVGSVDSYWRIFKENKYSGQSTITFPNYNFLVLDVTNL